MRFLDAQMGRSVTETLMASVGMKTSHHRVRKKGKKGNDRERLFQEANHPVPPQRAPLPFSFGGERTDV